ncbi:MAG: flagellar basal body L-ring protein FlgH [Planctomycetota bacterium]
MTRIALVPIATALAAALAAAAAAQDGGLLHSAAPDPSAPLTLENSSYTFTPLPPEAEFRELRKEDIITVLVDYRTSTLSEGETETRKTASINGVLADWLGFDGKSIFAAPQSRGDPTVTGTLNSQFRAEGDLETRDSLTFRIAAKIVDIRPNGNLVVEAHRTITINEEQWEQSLTGVVRRQSIGPDRTVRSDAVADLKIHKREVGTVRNAYSPGWLNSWWGRFKPF